MTSAAPGGAREGSAAGLAVAAGGGLLLAASLALSWAGVSPFRTWSYQLSWYPLLLAVDGAYAWRTGRFALFGRPGFAASLFLWSIPAWFFFEALNFRLGNWFYVDVPQTGALRWTGYAAAFATVLPAVYLPERWLRLGLDDGDVTGPSVPVGRAGRRIAGAAGVLFLLLPLWRPTWFYPLVWGAAALILEPWLHARDPGRSLLGDLERGRYGRIVRLLLAGLAAGLAWETMNSVAGARWIYTVPGLEGGKLFEMPVPGFLGFTVFGLECWVMYRALVVAGVAVEGWNGSASGTETRAGGRRWEERAAGETRAGGRPTLRAARTAGAALLAAVFCAAAALGVDRWTVASHRPTLEGFPGIPGEDVASLRSAGITTVRDLARADPLRIPVRAQEVGPGVAARSVQLARLAELRGLGSGNAALLYLGGIEEVCDLAAARGERVADLLSEGQRVGRAGAVAMRARVWVRAAREACPPAER